ncbi:hypothetical protein HDV01_002798 [Terramyces sp. JEL0728]|nr:hypothetical protein HDV01_002798 [Terramyces sp. JEL0728]
MTVVDSAQYQLTVSNANQNNPQIPVLYLTKLAQHMNRKVILFAVITSIKPPFKTKGTDYSMTIVVHDPTVALNHDGLSINIFDSDIDKFSALNAGDIVKCRFIVSHFGSKVQAVINKRKEGAVVNVETIELDTHESEIVKFLARHKGTKRNEKVYANVRPITHIKEIADSGYYDLFGKVVLLEKSHGCYLIGLTDYTANNKLAAPLENFKESLPESIPNNMLIVVTCWDLRCNVELGMYVSLRNARSKLNSKGRLELVVHEDTRYHDRLAIKEADRTNEYVMAIKKREHENFVAAPIAVKIEETEQEIATPTSDITPIITVKETKEQGKFKVKIKVVDYMPFKLEYFARPYCHYCKQALNLTESVVDYSCPSCHDEISDYIWLFTLLIEFLGDFYPAPLTNDQAKVREMKEKLAKYFSLVGLDRIKESKEIECWIKAFYVEHNDEQALRYKFLSVTNK